MNKFNIHSFIMLYYNWNDKNNIELLFNLHVCMIALVNICKTKKT